MKNKIYLIGIIIILTALLFPIVNAEIIKENSLTSLGYTDFIVEKGYSLCQKYTLNDFAQDAMATHVLQLKIDNFIPLNENSRVSIKINLNGKQIIELKDNNIIVKNIIKLGDINKENELIICVDNNFLPKINISKQSIVGSYYLSEIKGENFYQITPENIYVNTLYPIEVVIKNTGAKEIYIKVYNSSKTYTNNSQIENVSGETTYEGLLGAGETKKMKYFIKTDQDVNFSTPRAILNYTNEFGNQITMYSKQEVTKVNKINDKALIDVEINRMVTIQKETTGKLVIRNISEENIENIAIIPKFDGEIQLSNTKIIVLEKKDVVEIPFTIKTNKISQYNLLFNITYNVNGINNTTNTDVISINSVAEDNINKQIIAILIIITIILFIWVVKI